MVKRFFQRLRKKADVPLVEASETKKNPPDVAWQHEWSFDERRNALLESIFSGIPNKILLRVFKLLPVPDLCDISLVCRRFKMIADQDEIWKLKCNSKYYIFLSLSTAYKYVK
jgi:hypothetical protein